MPIPSPLRFPRLMRAVPILGLTLLAVAVSIAGPGTMFSERFFANAQLPFLMIAGRADAMLDLRANALPMLRKIVRGGLLSIDGASHAGFAAIADEFPMRLLDNPDTLGCWALMHDLALRPGERPLAALGGPEDGVLLDATSPPCANGAPEEALAAGRQQMITRLAALAFFQSQLAEDPALRASQQSSLTETLGRDFPEARYQSAGAR